MAGPRKNAAGGGKAKKARVCNADMAAQHVASALANGAQAEKAFVIERMGADPGMARALASLIRTDSVSRALDQSRFAALKPLGQAMSTNCITFGSLPKQFKWRVSSRWWA